MTRIAIYNHPRTGSPCTFKESGTIVATAAVNEVDDSTDIAGGGEIIGYQGIFGDSGKVVIRDGDSSGAVILVVEGRQGETFDVHLPPEHWREFADAVYATVTGGVLAFRLHTLRARTRA